MHRRELETRAVRERLAALASDEDADTCVTDGAADPTLLSLFGKAYRLVVLCAATDNDIAGALVVPDGTMIPHLLLQTIAERLVASPAGPLTDA